MYLKRLTAQVTAIAIGCGSTAIYADANYTQRAKEQAERAAAAAAIAADQVEAARVAEPKIVEPKIAEPGTSTQGAETNVAPAGNAAETSTSYEDQVLLRPRKRTALKQMPRRATVAAMVRWKINPW